MLACGALAWSRAGAAGLVDTLIFGDAQSEQAHGLTAADGPAPTSPEQTPVAAEDTPATFALEGTEVVRGTLGEPARRLLPRAPISWQGGSVAFTLRVDPEEVNYVTLRLSGDDVQPGILILHVEGQQIGYRHLGDIEVLDLGGTEPALPGRFYYRTSPLPRELTRGRTQLRCEIRSTGPIWGYGQTFDKYQKPMTEPSRGLYRIYTHTDGYFTPPAGEKQGAAPLDAPVRPAPGPEVIDQVKARIEREITSQLQSPRPPGQMPQQFLAKAYHVKWTTAYRNPQVVQQVAAGADALYAAWLRNPRLAEADPSTPNPDWFGLGATGDAIRLLAGPLQPLLDVKIPGPGGTQVTRRAAWTDMLVASREWNRRHRRLYTNQSMIKDLYIYAANRGIAVLTPSAALPEAVVLRYLHESIGLVPWLGSETDSGPEKPLGDAYLQLTAKGLTKELGYVGNYGEVLDWVTQIYDVTRPQPGQPGDPQIKAQLARIAHARAVFRHPALDAEGYRAMRLESVVGWRDTRYPGDLCYGERYSWDGSALFAAAATLDAEAVGHAQQMFADNQFFAATAVRLKDRGFRVTHGLLGVPEQYETLRAQPPSPHRLPMTAGQPDFVFADEEDGVVAIKHGDEILYASLYWRARHAVNSLARVHHLTPRFERIATVRQAVEFEPSGEFYTRPDWTNFGFANGGLRYPDAPRSAHAGERLPIAKIPAGVKFKPGQENIHAGRGSFYTLRYGPYLIAMNTTTTQVFEVTLPAGAGAVHELVSGRRDFRAGGVERIRPRATAVFFFDAP